MPGYFLVLLIEIMENKKSSPHVAYILEDILGCKWSLSILLAIQQGVCRPGELTRSIDGLSTKVMNERLKKMVRYTLLEKHTFSEIPPRVEYEFTDFGKRVGQILDDITDLQKEVDSI